MHDRPTATELIAAVRQHLETALLPTITDQRLRFQTLVAAHVLGIVERELDLSEDQILAAWQRLDELLQDRPAPPSSSAERTAALEARNQALCELIRQGAFDAEPQQHALWQHLYQSAVAKLLVANPKVLARMQAEPPT